MHRINDADGVNPVLKILQCMTVDFPAQFGAAYGKSGQVAFLKCRLTEKLAGFHPDDIIHGYEDAVLERKGFMPGVADILQAAAILHTKRKNLEDQAWKAEQIKSLPEVDQEKSRLRMTEEMQRLREMQKPGRTRLSDEDFASLMQHHAALVRAAELANYRRYPAIHRSTCAFPGCDGVGSISPGGGGWYCGKHYSEMMG
jgi:hypothetical protein